MAIAQELTIDTTASAEAMFLAIFGDGVQLVAGTATYSGAELSSGIYTGALTTIEGISPTDGGVILSTGNVTNITNSDGSTNTNTAAGMGTDMVDGIDGDADLNAVAGVTTFDGAILSASFIPDGEWLTMQFVFSSEEYPEYVNGGVNDAFGVWINGQFVPVTVTVVGNVSIDTVNNGANGNLYTSNTEDHFNTEMDGFTIVMSFKAPVIVGEVNTIKIGIADGGDAVYDSNLLIMGNSVQTVVLAMDDEINVVANGSRTFDVLANDNAVNGALSITQINGQDILPGQTVTLPSGQQVLLNADGTITVFANGILGPDALTYTVTDGTQTDIGYITINTVAAPTPDGIVSGTSGDDLIDATYAGDPDGDLVDNNDGLGVQGTTGDADLIYAGAGNDTVLSGASDDIVYGGTGDDLVLAGSGNDSIDGGSGDDIIYGDITDVDLLANASDWSGPSTSLTVINSSSETIQIFWINGSGTISTSPSTIAPGGSIGIGTFESHNFVIRDLDGNDLQLITGAANQTVDYGASGLDDTIDGGDGKTISRVTRATTRSMAALAMTASLAARAMTRSTAAPAMIGSPAVMAMT